MVMKRWHVARNLRDCCTFHTAVRSMDEVIDYLLSQQCDNQWCSLRKQCPQCLCMNNTGPCLVCGHYLEKSTRHQHAGRSVSC
mmetsp:Transcript_45949/g.147696  ORF Transcript_45949/g.147696 Transcript_45949/m.147696 type:complete len:83 (+) Transcript_45949:166-414(+)